jgi:NAD(P)-dependent dehydrogenase (short-subunit alcohol dehydrogenase family)
MGMLEGHVVVITGGGSGMGRATAHAAASAGASVAVWDLNEAAARDTAAAVNGQAFPCDVCSPDTVEAAAAATVRAFGRVDGLLNAAGILLVEGGVDTCSLADWDRVINTNLRSIFLVSKYLMPELRSSGRGSIVNIASLYGQRGYLDECAYDASKGGVVNLTRQMAIQHTREGVRVNAVSPGEILTPMTRAQFVPDVPEDEQIASIAARVPMGRMGRPEEVAAVIAFLLSEEASYVSGAIVPVDGAFAAG